MGLTERHWFENEDVPENYEWALEDAVLKEQEAIKPDYDPATLTWSCGNCGQTFDRCKNNFFHKCGKKVKWDAAD